MRVDPIQKNKVPLQVTINKITKVIAIVVAFLSTFVFFIKILFF
jgi:hypothetical protein